MKRCFHLLLVNILGVVNVTCESPQKKLFTELLGGRSKNHGCSRVRPRYSKLFNNKAVGEVSISGGGSDRKRSLFPNIFGPMQGQDFSPSSSEAARRPAYNPLRMYLRCMAIVMVWITSGTLFYSICNNWPIPQSFFYAVDAGMSIGFCTQVYETKLISKAFTILYILLGASVVAGALALFIGDALEGLTNPAVDEYQVLLETDAFAKADTNSSGSLNYSEFEALINSSFPGSITSEEDMKQLFSKFDRIKDGVIHFEEFVGTFRGIDRLVKNLKEQQKQRLHERSSGHRLLKGYHVLRKVAWRLRVWLEHAWQLEHRIYFAFTLWIGMGILWGILDQKWDPITATHFAVSALATGGLTAPDVNDDGILPADPAIFCGIFCLVGIPLFALTLGHFARVLVSGHVAEMERFSLTRPLTAAEYEIAAKLATEDSYVHLSDFIVLQLLRQGRLSMEAIEALKQNFEMLDVKGNGSLTLQQVTSPPIPIALSSSIDWSKRPKDS